MKIYPILKNSRRDLRIGLFALFVVRKDYQPRARSFETNGNNHHQHAKEKENEEGGGGERKKSIFI